jgi:ubiquinone/menaquinone biosynthesis C-methylase UbiE
MAKPEQVQEPGLPDRSPAHARRTIASHAEFFQPYLSAGMSLLDVGCGPGTITVGLAAAVSPGPVLGIDRNPEVLQKAVAGGRHGESINLRFALGDTTSLPCADESFDAVFIHALLQHLPDPSQAVGEAARVLRPRGVIGIRDADYDGSLIFPQDPRILRSLHVMTELRERRGTSPRVGKQLRSLLVAAGFEEVVGSAVATCDASPERTAVAARDVLSYWQSDAFLAQVATAGLAPPDEMASFVEGWLDWSNDPSAYWVRVWCEVTGRLPPAS